VTDRDTLMAIARDVEHSAIDPADVLLSERAAFVTGGGGGIGQGIALGLARFGCDVAFVDIVAERCTATEAAIRRLDRQAFGIPCDVMDVDALRAAVGHAAERLGRLDILVNNAGGVRGGPFMTIPERSIRRHVDLNLVSTFVATQAAGQVMIDGGRGGAIVNVASIEASRAAPMYAVYAACKAAIVNFTRTMALELSEHGIRVNCISPDHTITPGLRGNHGGPVDPSSWAEPDPDAVARLIPLGREGLVEDCASAAVWLCSDMSSYVTGINVNVDGGTWASGGWLRRAAGGWTLNP
jgi:NAD(P)-dependent dehydrogenase (short-subunit alcohol dehydrogenase family)